MSTKENARTRDEGEVRIGEKKRQRLVDNGAAVDSGAVATVLTFACRPVRHCSSTLPAVSISLKQGPGVVSELVKYLFDSKLEALTGQRDESHLWYVRDNECRRTLLSNNSHPLGDETWFDDEESEKSDDENHKIDLDHLKEGDSMQFSYDEHSGRPIFYKFTVVSVAPLVDPDEVLPRCTVPASRSEFTQAEKKESESYRNRREELAQGGRLICFSRSRYRRGKEDGIFDLPAEGWGIDELEGMKCLIAAEVGFKAAWKDLLQHAFLSRSKAATSNKYYELKKIMSPISPTSNAQKDVLRRKAFGKLLTCREDCFARMSVAVMEGLSAKAWAQFHKWDEIYKLMGKRNDELTEEQRKRKSELFDKHF